MQRRVTLAIGTAALVVLGAVTVPAAHGAPSAQEPPAPSPPRTSPPRAPAPPTTASPP